MTDALRADRDEPLNANIKGTGVALGLAPKTIRRHIEHGNLRGVWLGGALRVPWSEIKRANAEGLPRLPPMPDARRQPGSKAKPRRPDKATGPKGPVEKRTGRDGKPPAKAARTKPKAKIAKNSHLPGQPKAKAKPSRDERRASP